MNEFQKYLKEKAHISKKYISYYLKWVKIFLNQLSGNDKTNFSSEEKENFLLFLSSEHEDWQIKQADHVLRLYRHFLSITADKKSRLNNLVFCDFDHEYMSSMDILGGNIIVP